MRLTISSGSITCLPVHAEVRVLGLETSCDETSAAVVRRDGDAVTLEGLVVLSQDVHRIFGGVVPELASRAHLLAIDAVVDDALAQAHAGVSDIDAIAVTRGPGLLGALIVGVTWAKTIAWRERLPLIGVHHLEGHLFAATLESPDVQPPFTALLVSGGHTLLLDVPAWGEYRLLGQTRDDAAGEAFDKVGSLLGLEYPAGAAVERLAADGDRARFVFPRPLLKTSPADADRFAFSFSGLKTAVLRAVQQSPDLPRDRAHIARGFQDAVIDVLVAKTALAARSFQRRLVVIGGGVACNLALTSAMRDALAPHARVAVASPRLNTDNAAMIAAAGSWRLMRGEHDGFDLEARDALPLPGLQHPSGVVA
jgi:N6-L-threonylcarbamoyladenine synthase